MCLCRHLRQMGHAQYLPVAAQRPQLPADHFRYPTADAAVDLIEDQGRDTGGAGGDDLDRQADTRQLAA